MIYCSSRKDRILNSIFYLLESIITHSNTPQLGPNQQGNQMIATSQPQQQQPQTQQQMMNDEQQMMGNASQNQPQQPQAVSTVGPQRQQQVS